MEWILRLIKETEVIFHDTLLRYSEALQLPNRQSAKACFVVVACRKTALAASYSSSPSSNSTSRHSDCNSLMRTLKDSGRPGSRVCLPLTMASYILVRPDTSSDLTVRNSCKA